MLKNHKCRRNRDIICELRERTDALTDLKLWFGLARSCENRYYHDEPSLERGRTKAVAAYHAHPVIVRLKRNRDSHGVVA